MQKTFLSRSCLGLKDLPSSSVLWFCDNTSASHMWLTSIFPFFFWIKFLWHPFHNRPRMTPAVAKTNHRYGENAMMPLSEEGGTQDCTLGLSSWFGTCQAENSSPFKSSDLQRTFTTTPRGVHQLQQCPRQHFST